MSKSNHKHKYQECILVSNNNYWNRAVYCTICGKIKNVIMFETRKMEDGRYYNIEQSEVKDMYYYLPRFNVESIFQKYISKN